MDRALKIDIAFKIGIVDNYNHPPAKAGTESAFKELGYTVLFEQTLPANFNGDVNNWWNGLYVAVVTTK